jgi:hypothetical protein
MKRMLILFSLVLALIIASTTYAAPPTNKAIKNIEGEWATSGTRSCVQADAGGDFGPGPQYRLLTDGSTRVTQEAGVLRLFGDGTGSWSGKFIQINNHSVTAYAYPVTGYITDCDVTYQAMPDGTLKFTFNNCEGTFTEGYLTGSTEGGYTDVVEYARLSTDGGTLLIWDLDPNVQTTWATTSGVTTTYKKICSRTGTAIRIK